MDIEKQFWSTLNGIPAHMPIAMVPDPNPKTVTYQGTAQTEYLRLTIDLSRRILRVTGHQTRKR